MRRVPDPDKVRNQIDAHPRGGHCASCPPYSMYGPCCYPDHHHGWTVLTSELAWAFTAGLRDDRHHPWDDGHTPLRWRLLVHYRDRGTSWADIGRLFGIPAQAACVAYSRWAHRICCPIDNTDTKAA